MIADFVSDLIQRLLGEGTIGMAEAARQFGIHRRGRQTHPSTITRWCLDGIRIPDGRKVKLEYIRVGDRLMTSMPAILRFLAAQQDRQVEETASQPRSPMQRKRAAAAAADELAAAGV